LHTNRIPCCWQSPAQAPHRGSVVIRGRQKHRRYRFGAAVLRPQISTCIRWGVAGNTQVTPTARRSRRTAAPGCYSVAIRRLQRRRSALNWAATVIINWVLILLVRPQQPATGRPKKSQNTTLEDGMDPHSGHSNLAVIHCSPAKLGRINLRGVLRSTICLPAL
jgi:hypothetical protein